MRRQIRNLSNVRGKENSSENIYSNCFMYCLNLTVINKVFCTSCKIYFGSFMCLKKSIHVYVFTYGSCNIVIFYPLRTS